MGKEVFPCPHCKGAISVDYADKDEVQDIINKALDAHKSPAPDLKPVLDALGALQPPKPLTACENGTCGHAHQVEALSAELGQTKAAATKAQEELAEWEAGKVHGALTPEFLEAQLDCPTCGPAVKAFVEGQITKRGLVEPKTVVPELPKTDEPGTDKMPWED